MRGRRVKKTWQTTRGVKSKEAAAAAAAETYLVSVLRHLFQESSTGGKETGARQMDLQTGRQTDGQTDR